MKFVLGVLYKTLSTKCEIRENRLSGSQTWRKGVIEFLPLIFPCLHLCGRNVVHKIRHNDVKQLLVSWKYDSEMRALTDGR